MSTEGRSAEPTSAAAAVESAGFVRLVTRADGDGLAASGLLARSLADRGTPFQVTIGRSVAARTEKALASAETARADDVTIVVGAADANVPQVGTTDRPATLAACEILRNLDATPDPILALAGLAAAGTDPGAGESEWLLETARDRGLVDRRPGLVVPTADPIDGVARSTRVRAPWSGDLDATREAFADVAGSDAESDADPESLDADDHRSIASAVALDSIGDETASEFAATAIQRVLRPYATSEGPFATIGGYADVLAATARTEPGTGAALAMGHDAVDPALSAWRDHGLRAHAALDGASTGRYDGLFVVGIDDGPVEAVARIAASYRSPEPTALAIGDGEAGLASREDALGATVEAVARELADETDGEVEYDGARRRGYLRYDPDVDDSAIIATVRGFL